MDKPRYCERCGKALNERDEVWLELSWKTNLYVDPKVTSVPEEESQGGFVFGKACAARVLKNGGKIDYLTDRRK